MDNIRDTHHSRGSRVHNLQVLLRRAQGLVQEDLRGALQEMGIKDSLNIADNSFIN